MYPEIQARFGANGGVITNVQALDAGMSPFHIRGMLRSGEWVVVRRGVYAERELWDRLDDYRGRPQLRSRAAILTMRRAHVLSHDSSAHELGLDILAPDEPLVHVTRPGFTNAWTEYGVKHHLAGYRPEQVVEVNGMRVLNAARVVVDIGRERGMMHGVPVADSAMRAGTERQEMVRAYEPMENWPGVTGSRAAVDFADPGAESVGESLARLLVRELDIGLPITQFPVRTAKGVAWCDLLVGCHVFEFDGRVKYLRPEQGGVAARPVEQVVWDEKDRQRLVCSEGLGMSRIIWADFWGRARAEARARLQAEYAVTLARFGDRLPHHLAEFARQMGEQRTRRLTA